MNSCEITINDSTVSRYHAMLQMRDGEIYIEDKDSRFGTLIELREPLELTAENPYYIQVGNSVIGVLVKEQKTLNIEKACTQGNKQIENWKKYTHFEPNKQEIIRTMKNNLINK